jgi:hypothetical protein
MLRTGEVRSWVGAVVGLALLVSGVGEATADIIPVLDGGAPTNNGNGTFTYNYHGDVTIDQNATTGDYLTLYDFSGLVPSSITVAPGWKFSVQNLGTTPSSVVPVDDPTIPNIVFTRTGGTLLGPSSFTFSAASTHSGISLRSFTGVGTRSDGPNAGSKIQNVGMYVGPNSTGVQVGEAPEPASAILLGIGLPVTLMVCRRYRKK